MELNIFGREIYVNKGIVAVAVILLALAAGIVGYALRDKDQIVISASEKTDVLEAKEEKGIAEVSDNKDQKNDVKQSEQVDEIKVYVVGCVKNAGIVTLKKGQIVDDAVRAAGGVTKDADIENINLAMELTENAMLKILSKKEVLAAKGDKGSNDVAAEKNSGEKASPGLVVVKDTGSALVKEKSTDTEKTPASSGGKKSSGKININTASESELDSLPGIGEKTAKDIIAYREANGNFEKIEEIMNVPRIGESRFNSLKDLITVN